MRNTKSPVYAPVHPVSLECLLVYPCPACGNQVPMLNPVNAGVAQCPHCGEQFPFVPMDEKNLLFLKVMLKNGKCAVAPDYM